MSTIPLSALTPGQSASLVGCEFMPKAMHLRLQELGFIPGTRVTCLYESPLGDPCAYRVPDGVFALRARDACRILVQCP